MGRRRIGWLGVLLACGPVLAQEGGLPPVTREERGKLSTRERVMVRGLRFAGNRSLTDAQLLAALAEQKIEWKDRELSIEELEAIRQALTLAYVNKGLINSGALLPDQDVADGVIAFQLVEGTLTDVRLRRVGAGLPWAAPPETTATTQPSDPSFRFRPHLHEGFLRNRIERGTRSPLNVVRLSENLELLRQDPNVRRVNAELKPGVELGESVLDVTVEENSPWRLALDFNNRRPPSIGAERFELYASNTNVLGFSDVFAVRWGLTTGGLDDMEFGDADDFQLSYAIPITPWDTTLFADFTRSDSGVIEERFQELGITSESDSFSIGLRQALYRSSSTELAVSLALAVRNNQTFLLGEPFSFSPGADDGETKMTALRFGQEWSTRNQDRAIAIRSTFSFGIDALDSTVTDAEPDSQFLAWLGQFQYVRRLGKSDNQLILRTSAQLSSDPLLSIEQFSIGGFDTVRGYRENQVVRDSGIVASVEFRFPLLRQGGRSVLELAPFLDAGYGWNKDGRLIEDEFLASAGLGLIFNYKRLSGQLYWGVPFEHFDDGEDDDLQDVGIHFSIVWQLF